MEQLSKVLGAEAWVGSLSRWEFKRVLGKLLAGADSAGAGAGSLRLEERGVEQLFELFDLNEDGRVEWLALVGGLLALAAPSAEQQMRTLLTMLQTNSRHGGAAATDVLRWWRVVAPAYMDDWALRSMLGELVQDAPNPNPNPKTLYS